MTLKAPARPTDLSDTALASTETLREGGFTLRNFMRRRATATRSDLADPVFYS